MITHWVVYVIQILCHFVASAFSKMCLILEKEIENTMGLKSGQNFTLIILSTIMSAVGKLTFTIYKGVGVIPYLFIAQGICFVGCLYGCFSVFRVLQGFFAGWLLSIVFYLTGMIGKKSKSFEYFTASATIISTIVPICGYFYSIRTLFWLFAGINFLCGCVCFYLNKYLIVHINQTVNDSFPTFLPNSMGYLLRFAFIDGAILACVLTILSFLSQRMDIYLNASIIWKSVMLFLSGLIACISSTNLFITYACSIIAFIFYLLSSFCPILLIMCGVLVWRIFNTINPMICRMIPNNQHQIYFFIRSIITALSMFACGFLGANVCFICIFILVVLFGQEN